MIRVVFLGPPGSGKGTQANLISHKYDIPNISTGMILRQELTKNTSKYYKNQQNIIKVMHTGDLVNDAYIIQLINTHINQNNCYNGFILDGFPRTINQALSMTQYRISIDYVIEFIVSDDIIIDRITGRKIHPASGRTYHVKFNPPQNYGLDDITGEALITRKDDCEAVVRKRLNNYHQYTEPLLDYYKKESKRKNIKYAAVDGNLHISDIYKELINIFNT